MMSIIITFLQGHQLFGLVGVPAGGNELTGRVPIALLEHLLDELQTNAAVAARDEDVLGSHCDGEELG